jgi:hypothetical protein
VTFYFSFNCWDLSKPEVHPLFYPSTHKSVHQPEDEAQNDADNDARRYWEENGSILSAIADVAGQSSQRDIRSSRDNDDQTYQNQQTTRTDEEFCQRVHLKNSIRSKSSRRGLLSNAEASC